MNTQQAVRQTLTDLTQVAEEAASEIVRLREENASIKREILVYHDDRLKLSNEVDRLRAALGLIASLEKQPADEPVACGNCNGSGRMMRDPDIGTDQECFVCEGSGVCEDTRPQPAAPAIPEGMALVPKRMTKAMRYVTDQEDWTWEDLLRAAEAITEAEYNLLAAELE